MVGSERGEGGLVGSFRTPSKSKWFDLNTLKSYVSIFIEGRTQQNHLESGKHMHRTESLNMSK